MKKLFVCVALLGLVAATASAELVNNNDRSTAPMYTATAQPMDTQQARFPGLGHPYVNTTFGSYLTAVSATGGSVSVDDYNLANGSASWELTKFQFVGGVANAGEVLFFTFFTPGFAPADSFGVQFPQGGNFIWTITIGTPAAHVHHNGGYYRMWADDGSVLVLSTGTWFMDELAPTRGTTGPAYPGFSTTSGAPLNHKFQIVVPEPATLAMFGMGVLTLIVRRRR